MAKARGRPRKFDENQAVVAAMNVFWQKGFAATSLDDLSDATGINRPSLYNAFGDKEAIYRLSLEAMRHHMRDAVAEALAKPSLKEALVGFYNTAIDVYVATEPQSGCFVFCTVPAEAINHPELKTDMREILNEIDDTLEARIVQAVDDKDLSNDVDAKGLAKLAQAVLHTIALRARAGETKTSLRKLARNSVDLLIGPSR